MYYFGTFTIIRKHLVLPKAGLNSRAVLILNGLNSRLVLYLALFQILVIKLKEENLLITWKNSRFVIICNSPLTLDCMLLLFSLLEIITSPYNVPNFRRESLLHQGKWKNISATIYEINNMAYNVYFLPRLHGVLTSQHTAQYLLIA